MEGQIWDYYHTYINRRKVDRIETPLAFAGVGSACDKYKGIKGLKDVLALPEKPKKSALEMFHKHKQFKSKKRD